MGHSGASPGGLRAASLRPGNNPALPRVDGIPFDSPSNSGHWALKVIWLPFSILYSALYEEGPCCLGCFVLPHALPLGAPRPRLTGAPSVSMRIALGAVLRPKVREHCRFLLGWRGQRTAPRVMWWPLLPTHQIRPQSRRTRQS